MTNNDNAAAKKIADMTTTVQNFTVEGRHFVTITDIFEGDFHIQKSEYAPHARPYAGAEPGVTEVSVALREAENATEADMSALMERHAELCSEEGYRSALPYDAERIKAFLVQTRGWGTLWATATK